MARERLFTRPFVLCSVANFAQGICFHLFVLLPRFLQDLGADKVQIGLIFGIASISAIAARPPLGRWMDSRGRRGAILVGNGLNAATTGLYLTLVEIGPWVYVVRVLHGLAGAVLFTSLFTLAADHVPASRRTEGLALFGVSGMLPIGLGPLLGETLLARADFDALFRVALGLAIASLLLSLPLRDARRPGSSGSPSRGFRAALGQRDLLPLWWIGGVFATALASVFAFIKLFVDDTGLGSTAAFFLAYSVTAIGLRIALGWLPDRVGPKRALLPALVSLAAGFAVLALARQPHDVALAGALFGIGHGYAFPILFGMVVTRAGEADRGSAMAIYTALFDAGMLVGGPLFGSLFERTGSWSMFGVGALAVLAGSAVFYAWDRGRS